MRNSQTSSLNYMPWNKSIRDFFVVDISSDAEETVTIEVLNDAEWMGCDLKINKSRSCES